MNIKELRDFCLSLPGVTEATPFEKFSKGRYAILVFYVSGHMFCYFNGDDFSSVTLKGGTEWIEELRKRHESVGEPFNGSRRRWMSVRLRSDVDDDLLMELTKESYRLVRRK